LIWQVVLDSKRIARMSRDGIPLLREEDLGFVKRLV
jgi:hypothetical protein